MTFGERVPMRKRVLRAIWALILNAVLWIVIPYYLGAFLANRVPQSPITIPTFVYEFGILFVILEVGAAFFRGMATSVPFVSGSAFLSAIYIWLVTNGGNLSFEASGIEVVLGFRLLLYVLVLPSIWAAIRAPLSYLVWKRNGGAQPTVSSTPA
jgi:hypothetical protein